MELQGMAPEVAKKFKYWQTRTIIASMIGYALFYFVRKNLSIAMPAMQDDLGITKGDLGLFLTLHGLLYGVSKFANGFVGDRVNARYFMVTGLVLSAACNIWFGFSSAVVMFGIVWMLNGWFQGMGFPPCARLLTHWIPPTQLATKMSVWNTSHSVGAGLVVIVCGYIVSLGWRWCFWFPSIIALVGAVGLWFALRDTPRSVGLPELNSKTGAEEKEDTFLFILEQDYFTSLKHNAEVELPVEDHSPVSTPANQNANDFLSDCPFPFTAESVMENPAKSKNKVDTVQHILQTVLTKGPDYGIHTILQVNKLDNLLFQEYSLNKKDIYSMFQYVVVQRTDSETAIKLALSDDFKPEQMSDDHERLRSYFRNDITGAEILYCPFDSITVNDIKNLMK